MNIIRLSIPWEGIERDRGQYNWTIVRQLKDVVSLCEKNGMYVLLDMHQDAFSPKFCGNGVPDWVVQPIQREEILGYPWPLRRTPFTPDTRGYISSKDCESKPGWAQGQLSLAHGTAWQRFFDNYDGIFDSFVDFWRMIAKEFGWFSNVLGYDLINEPFAGNTVENPSLLLPGVGDKVNLQRFNERLTAAIREVDPVSIVTYESVTWDNVGVGYTRHPDTPENGSKTAHNWHYYVNQPNIGSPEVTTRQRVKDALRLGSGSIMSEFSIRWDCGDDCNEEHVQQMEAAETARVSWIGWVYKGYDNITGSGPGLWDEWTGE
ncbi:hypothetical protein HK097_001262, partial [Rhizophlyctis rosea]